MQEINNYNEFEAEVLAEDDRLVLVKVYAPWCGPCKAIDASLATLEPELSNTVKFVKASIDTPENERIKSELGIRSIPTLVLYEGGTVKATITGTQSLTQIQSFIETNLN